MVTIEERSRRVTASDVAKLAGLSRSTVSAILGGNGELFSPETRERVHGAAGQLNYRPSRAGRALVTGVTDIVMVLVPNVTFGRHLQDAVDRIAGTIAPRGLTVLVRYAGDDQAATLTAVLDLRPYAVIDLGVFDEATHMRIRAAGSLILPDIEPRQLVEDPVHLGGRLQARHLLRTGPRRLIYAQLADDRNDAYGPARLRGVADEAADQGLPAPLTVQIPLDALGAVEALRPIVEDRSQPLGICCYNDDVAAAVLAACRILGVDVPDTVAIIGADRSDIGQLMSPRLTTIATDLPGIMALYLGELDEEGAHRSAESSEPEVDFRPFIAIVPGETG